MAPVRIAHGARGAQAPANTAAAVGELLQRGVEGIEVDVARDATGRLALCHGRRAPAGADALDAVLELVAALDGPRPLLVLDLKAPGLAAGLAAAVRRHGLAGAVLVTARQPRELRGLAAADPGLARGWSLRWPWHAALLGGRLDRRAPVREAVRRAVAEDLSGAVMLHHSLVAPGVVAAVHDAGGTVYAWTVDDPGTDRRVREAGVDGVISDRLPRA